MFLAFAWWIIPIIIAAVAAAATVIYFAIRAPHVINLSDLRPGNRLADGDIIELRTSPGRGAGPVEVFLEQPPPMGFTKEIKGYNIGTRFDTISVQGDRRRSGPFIILQEHLRGAQLVFSKGKLFNILTPMYQINGLENFSGQVLTFVWARD